MKVKLAEPTAHFKAPRPLVFQMLSAIGKGTLPGAQGESSKVLERDGDTIIAEFMTPSGKRTYRTVEEVQLYPPERITFRHLEGPLVFSEEEFNLTEQDAGTELRYKGKMECRVPWMPGIGWLIAMLYVRPKYNKVIREHMKDLKVAAEARAARSHLFRQAAETLPNESTPRWNRG